MRAVLGRSAFKEAVFFMCCLPMAYSAYQIYQLQVGQTHGLGADPGKALVLLQGDWAIRCLLLALAVSPLKMLTGWHRLNDVRRMLGLFAFFYASTHLLAYLLFLQPDLRNIGEEVMNRPHITLGLAAYMFLIPLALTSNNRSIRVLKHNWARLHRVVYGVAILTVFHVLCSARASYLTAFIYGFIVAILLFSRLFEVKIKRAQQRAKASKK